MDFEVFKRVRKRKIVNAALQPPHVTFQRTANTIYLNRRIMDMLDSPFAVRLLFDATRRVMGLQPAEEDDDDAFKLGGPPDRSNAYICAAAFLRHYNLEHAETVRYACEMQDGILCIYLDKPIG